MMSSSTYSQYLERYSLCCHKQKCRICRRYLSPNLYSDSHSSISNAYVNKSTQRGGSSVYKALRETLEQHVFDGGDVQSLEFFIDSNDGEIPTHSQVRHRHIQVTYLQALLVFIFTLQEYLGYFNKTNFQFFKLSNALLSCQNRPMVRNGRNYLHPIEHSR